jgi:hypothetical protein
LSSYAGPHSLQVSLDSDQDRFNWARPASLRRAFSGRNQPEDQAFITSKKRTFGDWKWDVGFFFG